MFAESLTALFAASAILGVAAGEILDVWYDMTHAEVEAVTGAETILAAPRRPLAFGYCKAYFREVLLTPDAFEHYHWGLWLAVSSVTVAYFNAAIAFVMIGVAVSLVLDENRRGLADRPFGVGKPYFQASATVGILLVCALVIRIVSISSPFEYTVSVVSLVLPFILLLFFWVFQNWPRLSLASPESQNRSASLS